MGNVILELFSALKAGSFTKKKKEMGLTTVDVSDKKISGTLNVSSLEVSWKDAEIAEDLIIGPGMLN
ncbi:unnamed protein product [Eretmochelys imbricata]